MELLCERKSIGQKLKMFGIKVAASDILATRSLMTFIL